jgi:hypothetical protein
MIVLGCGPGSTPVPVQQVPTTEILKVYLKNASETGQLGSEMSNIDEEIAKLVTEDAAKGNALKTDFEAVTKATSEAAVKSKVKEMIKKL